MEGSFDCVLNTMAFSGYPDAAGALAELLRVLKPEGRLVLIDVNHPRDGNSLGTWRTGLWKHSGDLIRDLDSRLERFSVSHVDEEIGGWGSIHLYRAVKPRHRDGESTRTWCVASKAGSAIMQRVASVLPRDGHHAARSPRHQPARAATRIITRRRPPVARAR